MVTARYAYDPFGKRRFTNGNYDTAGQVVSDWNPSLNAGTARGFTGQEEMDDIGLVNLNGRIYDASIGRFIQVDPNVADTSNLQAYDRYAYVNDNPLNATDPSGFVTEEEIQQNMREATAKYNRDIGGLPDNWTKSDAPIAVGRILAMSAGDSSGSASTSLGSSDQTDQSSGAGNAQSQPVGQPQRAASKTGSDSEKNRKNQVETEHQIQHLHDAKGPAGRLTAGAIVSNLWNSPDNWLGFGRQIVTDTATTTWNFLDFAYADAVGDTPRELAAVNAITGKGRSATIATGMLIVGTLTAAGESEMPIGAKVNAIHQVLAPRAQTARTTGVLRTDMGDLAAGGTRDLDPAQRAIAESLNAQPVKLANAHAEVTLYTAAKKMGAIPLKLETSWDICDACRSYLEKSGATITGNRTAEWSK